MKISYERKDSVELFDADIERIAVLMKRGSSFDDAFYEIICGYDDDIFYKRDFIKDEVEKIVQNTILKDNQQVVITIDNLTESEARRIVSKIVDGTTFNFHLGIPEDLPVKIDVNTIEEN